MDTCGREALLEDVLGEAEETVVLEVVALAFAVVEAVWVVVPGAVVVAPAMSVAPLKEI